MKAVILAGGQGERMQSGYSGPKPLLEIGGWPILLHVIDIYLDAGVDDFIVCCGSRCADVKQRLGSFSSEIQDADEVETRYVIERGGHRAAVLAVDTGPTTQTAGRLHRVRHHLDGTFAMTYSDGLADVDIRALQQVHTRSEASVTLTAVPLTVDIGVLELTGGEDLVRRFEEKPTFDDRWCNAGFYIIDARVVGQFCVDDHVSWESDVLPQIAAAGSLAAYRHGGFWSSVNTPHEYEDLMRVWEHRGMPWRRVVRDHAS